MSDNTATFLKSVEVFDKDGFECTLRIYHHDESDGVFAVDASFLATDSTNPPFDPFNGKSLTGEEFDNIPTTEKSN